MDPFAAISLAGNILQFVVYAKDCYVQIKRIQKSAKGMSQKDEQAVESTIQMNEVLDSVTGGIKTLESGGVGSLTSTERKIRDVGKKCEQLASELRDDIERKATKNKSSVLRSTASIISATWKAPELDQKLNELDTLQNHLFRFLLAHIRYVM